MKEGDSKKEGGRTETVRRTKEDVIRKEGKKETCGILFLKPIKLIFNLLILPHLKSFQDLGEPRAVMLIPVPALHHQLRHLFGAVARDFRAQPLVSHRVCKGDTWEDDK